MTDITDGKKQNKKKTKIIVFSIIYALFLVFSILLSVLIISTFTISSVLYTAFTPPKYESTSSILFVANENDISQSFNVGQQIVDNSTEIIKGNDFCEKVARLLNSNEDDNGNEYLDTYKELLTSNPTLVKELGGNEAHDYPITKYTNGSAVTTRLVQSALNVTVSNSAKNTLTVTATTTNPKLSCIIANAATALYEEYVQDEVVPAGTNISTNIFENATVSQKASNKSFPKNVAIAVAIGFVITCAILFLIFFFDDKIKTPDDIEKHLELNILGTIPDFEESR